MLPSLLISRVEDTYKYHEKGRFYRLLGVDLDTHTTKDSTNSMAPANIYLIRHGDKPPKGADNIEPPYLSPEGEQRAKALIKSFEKYNIGLIIAQGIDDNDDSQRPLDTINPLATSLGVEIRTFATLNVKVAADTAKGWKGTGDVLICWEHSRLINLAMALGVPETIALPYDDFRFDLIWQVKGPSFSNIDSICSENTGADGGYQDEDWHNVDNGWQKKKATGDKRILQTWTFAQNPKAVPGLPDGPRWTMHNTEQDPAKNPEGDVENWVQRTDDAKIPYRNQWVRYEPGKGSAWKIKPADSGKHVIMV